MRNQDNPLKNDNVVETVVEVLNGNDVEKFHILGIFGGLRRLGIFRLLGLRFLFLGFFALNRVVYFSSMNRYLFRGRYPQTNLIPPYINDNNLNIIADHNRFISLSA